MTTTKETNVETIIAYLTENPGATAQEIGVSSVEMNRLAAKGLVEKVGSRHTGGRGRPASEWALPGADVPVRVTESTGPSIPSLPEVSREVRGVLTDSEARVLSSIEDTFAGVHGEREPADYRLHRDHYAEIVGRAERRLSRREAFTPEHQQAMDEAMETEAALRDRMIALDDAGKTATDEYHRVYREWYEASVAVDRFVDLIVAGA